MREYSIGLYEKALPKELTWYEKLSIAKNSGYDFIEISIDETEEKIKRLDMGYEERIKLISLMKDIGLPIRSMCLSAHRKYPLGSENTEIREKSLEIMKKALQLADDLGIIIIQLAGYDVYYEESNIKTRENFLHNLKKINDMAAKKGILMGFETMETEFMNTVEKVMFFVNKINSPYLNIYPDLGNITNSALMYNSNVSYDLEKGKGKLIAMHLKETLPNKFREIPFGCGHVDFENGIKKAWELGIRRYVTEFWYTGNKDWEKDINFAVKKMKKILDSFHQERN